MQAVPIQQPVQHSWYHNQAKCWIIQGLIPSMEKTVLFSKCSDQLSGPTRYQGFQGFSLPHRVQQLGCQTYCSPPPSAEVKKEWSYTSTPPCLHGIHIVNFCILAVIKWHFVLDDNMTVRYGCITQCHAFKYIFKTTVGRLFVQTA